MYILFFCCDAKRRKNVYNIGTFLYRQESSAKKLPTGASFANQM